MSHAVVLVAIDADPKDRDAIESEVGEQMAPFDEAEEWFRDGSRWDWWVVGGRWTGLLDVSGYNPRTDPANIEVCWLCRGTGRRDDELGRKARLDDPTYTCNGCRGDGRMVKHSLRPFEGDAVRVSTLRSSDYSTRYRAKEEARIRRSFAAGEKDLQETFEKIASGKWSITKAQAIERMKRQYDWEPDVSIEDYLAKNVYPFPATSAFLSEQNWHEANRLGWFGMDTATECEIRGKEVKRCRFKHAKTEAIVTTWNEDREKWTSNFFERFIAPLPDSKTIVVVDYHV